MSKRSLNEYALYKGEELLAMGTAEEIAKIEDVSRSTIHCYASASYEERLRNMPSKGKNARIAVKIN